MRCLLLNERLSSLKRRSPALRVFPLDAVLVLSLYRANGGRQVMGAVSWVRNLQQITMVVLVEV